MELSDKQQQFNRAMELYTSQTRYKVLGVAVSIANGSLQACLVYRIWPHSIGAARQLLALLIAYLVTDFVNGLVHMFMDNNDRYESWAGPLIANFHLHHKTPLYKKRNLLLVYFTESGSKIWLVGYLGLILPLTGIAGLNPFVLYVLTYVGILSSLAEVSHYLCHSSTSMLPRLLANCGLLLSKRHHAKHHLEDNCGYAFLNGATDPLLDLIAARMCGGYKQKTDLHYAQYSGADGADR